MGARVIEVVETDICRRGSGKNSDSPIRVVVQYWSKDGTLLAEVDQERCKSRDPLPCDLLLKCPKHG